jgi:hypothetical protein
VNEVVASNVFARYARNSVKPRIKVPLRAMGDARHPGEEGRQATDTARGRLRPKP